MKICVLGLDGAAPQVLFRDEELSNIRRLMDVGVYGLLECVVPPHTIPAWTCFTTSQDPGSLGLYGRRQSSDYSSSGLNPPAVDALTVEKHLAREGKRPLLLGVPQVGTGNTGFPFEPEARIGEWAGNRRADIQNLRTRNKAGLEEEVLAMSRKQWQIAKHLLREPAWDYFQFVDRGLDRLQHGFWSCFDPRHAQFKPGNPFERVIPDYYHRLDEQIGDVFELLDEETIVLVMSAFGAQRRDGVVALNEWLVREGLLVLEEYPSAPTRFEHLRVDWGKTQAWSEGGYCASIFFNVAGRDPQGTIPPSQLEGFANDLSNRLEAFEGEDGHSILTLVFRPREIYREVRGIAPDLIAQFGGLFWRAADSVGHSRVVFEESDCGSDMCNHSAYGTFILAAPNCPLSGEYQGAHLLDMIPTLLDLAGYEIPPGMQGRSLVAGIEKKGAAGSSDSQEAQKLFHDRLAGLGYI